MKYNVVIKSPSDFYGPDLFAGKVQVVEPPFDSEESAMEFIQKNKFYDMKVGLKYRYAVALATPKAIRLAQKFLEEGGTV